MAQDLPLHPSIITIRSLFPFENPGGPELIRDEVERLRSEDPNSAEDALLSELKLSEGDQQDRFLVAFMYLASQQGCFRDDTIDELIARCENNRLAEQVRRAAVYALAAIRKYNIESETIGRIETALTHAVKYSEVNGELLLVQAAKAQLDQLSTLRRARLALEVGTIVIPGKIVNRFIDSFKGSNDEFQKLGYTKATIRHLQLALCKSTESIRDRATRITRIGNTLCDDILGHSGYCAMIRTTWSVELLSNKTRQYSYLLTDVEFLYEC
ncbi:MAG: hypothetical protein V4719_15925 [Planctomycetota bacterium]